MPSSLTWLDHDAAAAGRSLRMLSLFNQPESRDELGIGGIRDAISDQLFPGTSTIQTRLRYVFFIPWLYGQLDASSVPALKFAGAAREAENKLLAALVSNVAADMPGVIGREAGSTLKRRPSSVYWAGLATWGLREFDGTIAQYFNLADQRQARSRSRRKSDDEESPDATADAWHVHLSRTRPEGFPSNADLDLTRAESEFLLDRWRLKCPDSLLTWLAIDMTRQSLGGVAERIWEHPRLGAFPAPLRALIEDAQHFDSLIQGAALLYNLQLAELEDQDQWISDHGAALEAWQDTQASQLGALRLSTFWLRVLGKGHSISPETQRFTHEWLSTALTTKGHIAKSRPARQLVELRERRLKGDRSRFKNQGARKQWGGAAGLTPMSYRWPIASSFLDEWHAGWSRA